MAEQEKLVLGCSRMIDVRHVAYRKFAAVTHSRANFGLRGWEEAKCSVPLLIYIYIFSAAHHNRIPKVCGCCSRIRYHRADNVQYIIGGSAFLVRAHHMPSYLQVELTAK